MLSDNPFTFEAFNKKLKTVKLKDFYYRNKGTFEVNFILNTFILIKKLYHLQYTFENYSRKRKNFEILIFVQEIIDEVKERKKLSKTIQLLKN